MGTTALDQVVSSPLPRAPYPDLRRLTAHQEDADSLLAADIVRRDGRFVDPTLRAAFPTPPPPDAVARLRRNKAAVRRVTDELVALAHRESTSITVYADGRPLRCTESSGHMEVRDGVFTLILGQTLSSNSAKRERPGDAGFAQHYNANLSVIRLEGVPVVVRSGRSDGPEKLEELLAFGAAHAPADTTTYRSAVISAMDDGVLKSWLCRLVGAGDERTYLAHQRQGIAALFPIGTSRTVRLADGRTVALAKPYHFNLVFSAQARNPLYIWWSRRSNLEAALALFDRFAQVVPHAMLADAMNDADTLAAKARIFARVVPLIGEELSRADWLACSALSLYITGKDLEGQRHLGPTGPGAELLLLGQLLKRCGVTPHVQCKSCQDRGPAMAAELVACDLFAAVRQDTLSTPAEFMHNAGDMSLLRWFFTQVADTFFAQHIRSARGVRGKVKWRLNAWFGFGHPVPQALYLPYNSTLGVKPRNDALKAQASWRERLGTWISGWMTRLETGWPRALRRDGYAQLP